MDLQMARVRGSLDVPLKIFTCVFLGSVKQKTTARVV